MICYRRLNRLITLRRRRLLIFVPILFIQFATITHAA